MDSIDLFLERRNFAVPQKVEVVANFGINIGNHGGTNYISTFDLPAQVRAAIGAGGATFRLTETCGNDLLVGKYTPSVVAVPETSTWVMGFLALGAVVVMVRRNAKAC